MDIKNGILNATETLVTDAASDELRAGRLMSGRSKSHLVEPIFKNFLNHVKDPCHASGRFLKTWTADPFLSAVFDFFIGDKGSITNVIQHSADIQNIFNKHIRASGEADADVTVMKGRACECMWLRDNHISWYVPYVLPRANLKILKSGTVCSRWTG
jgi:hypothetical protein